MEPLQRERDTMNNTAHDDIARLIALADEMAKAGRWACARVIQNAAIALQANTVTMDDLRDEGFDPDDVRTWLTA